MQLQERSPNFTVMEVVQRSSISPTIVTYRTFLRYVKRLAYGFFQRRRKGVLTKKDLKIRRKFVRAMAIIPQDYWTSDVAFYLDGVSFVYINNPMSDVLKPKNCVWRKRGEGLLLTTKGSKELAGGKRLHLLVAMAHGKGIICVEPYVEMVAHILHVLYAVIFPLSLKSQKNNGDTKPKLFVMDNDPTQTSAVARKALKSIKANMQVIPARSLDLNPIENLFHVVRKKEWKQKSHRRTLYTSHGMNLLKR